ncbi:MAG: hypothetical protein WDZ76_01615 [Pseudohongiellaceae bacterium]
MKQTYSTATLLLFFLSSPVWSQPANLELNPDGSYVLEVPVVGFQGNPGFYQNARFQSGESELSWTLLSVDEGQTINSVNAVDVITTSEMPIQVFLEVSGEISPCLEVGEYAMNRVDNSFEIFLYYDPDSFPPPGTACIDSVEPYSTVIPLPAYGLEAGEYVLSVNGEENGSFIIPADNLLP